MIFPDNLLNLQNKLQEIKKENSKKSNGVWFAQTWGYKKEKDQETRAELLFS